MKKLPRKLKSGKRLVAIAADGNIGLYCKGRVRKETSSYRILTRKGKLSRGLMGSGGYPIAPKGLKWEWRDRKKKRRKTRESRMARNAASLDPRAGRSTVKPKQEHVSIISICVECKRDSFRKYSHAHTLKHPDKGYAQTFCCKCARMMGYKCRIKRDVRAKKLAEKLLGKHKSVLVVRSGDEVRSPKGSKKKARENRKKKEKRLRLQA